MTSLDCCRCFPNCQSWTNVVIMPICIYSAVSIDTHTAHVLLPSAASSHNHSTCHHPCIGPTRLPDKQQASPSSHTPSYNPETLLPCWSPSILFLSSWLSLPSLSSPSSLRLGSHNTESRVSDPGAIVDQSFHEAGNVVLNLAFVLYVEGM